VALKVNIVMITYNRPRLAVQALETLRQNTDPELYTLTVMDDGSDEAPNNKEWAQQFPGLGQYQFAWNAERCGILSRLRNYGVKLSEDKFDRGDWLYFTDNDMYFTPRWLECLVECSEASERYGFGLWGAYNHPYNLPKVDATVVSITTSYYANLLVREDDAVAGASHLMRWSTWDRVGSYKETGGICTGDDWEYGERVKRSGMKIGSVWPRLVWNCGLTNSEGKPIPGRELVEEELVQARKQFPNIYAE
jgi:GT2 family glycosyltransferase